MTVRTLAFADLRAHLRPQESPTTLACHIAMLRYPIRLRQEPWFWDVAYAFQQRLHDSVRRGDRFLATRATRSVMPLTLRSRSFRMAETALSYSGALRLAPEYGPFQVRGLHAFVSNIPMGPEFTALARLNGEVIQWDFLYLGEDMSQAEAEGIAAEVLKTVEAAVSTRAA
jgi:hypothetical protein